MGNPAEPVRILVVDDDEVSREVLVLLMTRAGYAVEAVDSGEAAVAALRANGPRPGVVLTDMQMPGVAGVELARELRAVCGASTMLLAMSGSGMGSESAGGFDGFLLKPFTMEELAEAIAGGRGGAMHADGESIEVLNETTYGKLAAAMRKSQMEQLYALCVKDVERRILEMREAASRGDDAAFRKQAHAIKGGCGMVGAVELQTLAGAMEEQGLGNANHVASLDEFMLACERLQRILIAREIGSGPTELPVDELPGEDAQ